MILIYTDRPDTRFLKCKLPERKNLVSFVPQASNAPRANAAIQPALNKGAERIGGTSEQ